MTTDDRTTRVLATIARLREEASRATPGPWEVLDSPRTPGISVILMEDAMWPTAWSRDAIHIATWHPARVLALLDRDEATLRRHSKADPWRWCEHCGVDLGTWPCPDAAAVLDFHEEQP